MSHDLIRATLIVLAVVCQLFVSQAEAVVFTSSPALGSYTSGGNVIEMRVTDTSGGTSPITTGFVRFWIGKQDGTNFAGTVPGARTFDILENGNSIGTVIPPDTVSIYYADLTVALPAGMTRTYQIRKRVDAAIVTGLLTITSTAGLPVDGHCGLAANQPTAVAPTTNLCSAGVATQVTGTGPWNWVCTGLYGGYSPSCIAPRLGASIYSVTPTRTAQNLATGFNVQGTNLPPLIQFSMTGCAVAYGQSADGINKTGNPPALPGRP